MFHWKREWENDDAHFHAVLNKTWGLKEMKLLIHWSHQDLPHDLPVGHECMCGSCTLTTCLFPLMPHCWGTARTQKPQYGLAELCWAEIEAHQAGLTSVSFLPCAWKGGKASCHCKLFQGHSKSQTGKQKYLQHANILAVLQHPHFFDWLPFSLSPQGTAFIPKVPLSFSASLTCLYC